MGIGYANIEYLSLKSAAGASDDIVGGLKQLDNLDALKQLDNLDALKQLDDLDALKQLDDLDALKQLDDLDALKQLDDLDALKQLDDLDALKQLDDLDALKQLDDLDALKKLDDLDAVKKLDDLDAVKQLDNTKKLTKLDRVVDVGKKALDKCAGNKKACAALGLTIGGALYGGIQKNSRTKECQQICLPMENGSYKDIESYYDEEGNLPQVMKEYYVYDERKFCGPDDGDCNEFCVAQCDIDMKEVFIDDAGNIVKDVIETTIEVAEKGGEVFEESGLQDKILDGLGLDEETREKIKKYGPHVVMGVILMFLLPLGLIGIGIGVALWVGLYTMGIFPFSKTEEVDTTSTS